MRRRVELRVSKVKWKVSKVKLKKKNLLKCLSIKQSQSQHKNRKRAINLLIRYKKLCRITKARLPFSLSSLGMSFLTFMKLIEICLKS
jgi:hypothetical protein